MNAPLVCPVCAQRVNHDRGYLVEHSVPVMRGTLRTGQRLCDGSNRRTVTDLATVRFTGVCAHCQTVNHVEWTETYPGSLPKYGGVVVVNCEHCGYRDYCTRCNAKLRDVDQELARGDESAIIAFLTAMKAKISASLDTPLTKWADEHGSYVCHGEPHDHERRPVYERPVVLADNHVIVVRDDDDRSPEEDTGRYGQDHHET